jgi:hypothetical protein
LIGNLCARDTGTSVCRLVGRAWHGEFRDGVLQRVKLGVGQAHAYLDRGQSAFTSSREGARPMESTAVKYYSAVIRTPRVRA